MSDERCEELEGSELGTKTYWDSIYTVEINNFKSHGDVGEVWFGDDSLVRIVNWIVKCDTISQSDALVDIGCGNGMTLFDLAREGYTNLTGVDYSKPGIDLAISVCNNEFPNIRFKVLDFINDDLTEYNETFKVVHDKGTFDAISLHPEDPKTKKSLYKKRVHQILQNRGYFVITSCNWAESELQEYFTDTFQLKTIIPSPQFKFGGKVGSVVSSIVFEKAF